jgi:ADP-heptose:LPS heptosyltransferase
METLHNSSDEPIQPAFPALRSIAVFRALQLGDLLCIIPAVRAIRAAAPDAEITLIGLQWARNFAQIFDRYFDDFLEFPGFPGMPEQLPSLPLIPEFFAAAQQRRFDLALQFHGSGVLSNPLTVLLGARVNAGFYQSGQYCPVPQRFLLWDEHEHEVLRYLRLVNTLGAAAQGMHLEFPISASDRHSLQRCAGNLPPGGYACIHPGSQLPSRRWQPQRFANIADRLADHGLQVVLTGTAHEAGIARSVGQRMRAPALNLTGKTTLGALASLIADARLIVCNDTGVSHIAAAVATPSVVICSGADPRRWAPLDRARHRLLYHPVACRPCNHYSCPFPDHPCADGVSVEQVWTEVQNLLAGEAGYGSGTSPSSRITVAGSPATASHHV